MAATPHYQITRMISSSLSMTIYYRAKGRIAIMFFCPVELKENLSSERSTDLSTSWDLMEENREVTVGKRMHRDIRSFSSPSMNILLPKMCKIRLIRLALVFQL